MQIDRVYFPSQTLGYGSRISMWLIGCPHHCFRCSNPELWVPDPSRDVSVEDLLQAILPYLSKADGVTITGGEPFLQSESLLQLLIELRKVFKGDILVFTGYTIRELSSNAVSQRCLNYIDVLIDGKYEDDRNNNIGLRGSDNQTIHRLNPLFSSRYEGAESWKRNSQVVVCDNKIISIGIPIKEKKQ